MIFANLAVAILVTYSIMACTTKLMINKDFTIYDVNAYYDGKYVHIFATIKNTRNIVIKSIRVDLTVGGSSTVTLNLKGEEVGAINGLKIYRTGLAVRKVVEIKFTAIFQDNTGKARLIHVVLQEGKLIYRENL